MEERGMSVYCKKFGEIPSYSDPESRNQLCRDILPKGVVDDLLIGYDTIRGPGNNGTGFHSDFHQVFVVIKGKGTLHRGEERIPIEAPCIVHIPPKTPHDVFVADGENIEYVYVNKYFEGI
jgi:mannose-6-phosphate isomerase-like protein (cupin superfamily)